MVSLKRKSCIILTLLIFIGIQSGCQVSDESESSSSSGGPYLYVSSGSTYAGSGVTPSTASNTIVRYSLNGAFDKVIYDYNATPGDSPVKMLNYDDNYLLVLVENAGANRRVDLVPKEPNPGTLPSGFLSNAAITGAVVRDIIQSFDGGWLISRNTLIEKFGASKQRITIGAATPWISAPTGLCGTSATLIPSIVEGPGNNIVFAHANAAQNRIAMIKPTGWTGAGADCVFGIAAPTATHFPTTMLLHSSGKLFVNYSNNTGPIHAIYSYDLSSTTISNAASAFADTTVSAGISSMVEMSDGRILVSNAAPTLNTVEMLQYDSGANTLSRVGTTFIYPSVYTRSISSMLIAN